MRKLPQPKRYSMTPSPLSVVVTCHASGTRLYPYVVSSLLSLRRTSMTVLFSTSLACSRDVALYQAQAYVSIPKVSPFFRLLTCRSGYMSANVKPMSLEPVSLSHTIHTLMPARQFDCIE
ncbi:hypothetical protein QR685DRAFT_184049 [Neurospora intermedia]|uniref:Uncharacterized protein n=1 Tax=Neurospora intermedia TaxID=5142 RepID=A0ABR3DM31_NEUIN